MSPKGLFLLITTVSLIVNSVVSVCSPPWIQNGKSCYLLHNVTATLYGHPQKESEIICNRYGGNLLSIENLDEQKFISNLFNDPGIKRQHYWLGLNDRNKEGDYQWTDGTVFDSKVFNYWHSSQGEPNNYNNEDCVETTWDGRWNDNDCSRDFGFICKKTLDATPPPTPKLPPPPTATTQPTTCEAGWIPWGTSCYGIIKGLPKTFKDARADCLRRFGDLLIVNSTDEQNFLTNELKDSDAEFWMGLSDQLKEGSFHWVNTKVLDQNITNWGDKEPSNSFGNEDCVVIYGKYEPGKWNDDHCNAVHDYICEKQSGTHNCPEGWITYGDYCYEINAHPNQKASWNDSRTHCLDFNKAWEKTIKVAEADLVSVLSSDEEKMLMNAFRNNGALTYGYSFWTGLTSNNPKNEFIWSDGSEISYSPWKSAATGKGKCVKHNLDGKGGWYKADCNEKNFYACKVRRGKDRCFDPMGIQDYRIPDSAFTASGQLSMATPPAASRLYMNRGNGLDGAWCESNKTKVPWLQVDLGRTERLTYMGVQGKANSDDIVTAFYLKYSNDGVSWHTYGDIPPQQYFRFLVWKSWRTHNETVMNLPLASPFVARYVRIYPLRWHSACCMRIEFYGCPVDVASSGCGMGWVEDKSTKNCYHFSSQKTTWDASGSICSAHGASLASIASSADKKFVSNQLHTLSGKFSDYWIGLNDLDHEGFFRWSDGSPLVISNWYKDSPKENSERTNCIAMQSVDGSWKDEDCTSYRNYICKRTYKNTYTKKEPFNANWRSGTDFYWPMDSVRNNKVIGTQQAPTNGTFNVVDFPIPFQSKNQPRKALSFDGKDNYITIPYVDDSCLNNPDAESCIHGVSYSFLFKYNEATSLTTHEYILDTIGRSQSESGFYVSFTMSTITVYVQARRQYYTVRSIFNRGIWNHLVFTWSVKDGLQVYLNGKSKGFHLYGSSHGTNTKITVGKNPLYVGRSRDSSYRYTKMYFTSLAVYERVLQQYEVEAIYAAEFGRCIWGQIPYGSSCYEFNTMGLKWLDASKKCQSNGGQLMSIHSPDEQALLSLSSIMTGGFWIGLNSMTTNHVYNWTDGTPVSYSYWGAREPNNWGGRREDCVHTFTTGAWNDDLCYYTKPYACKYKRIPHVPSGELVKDPFNIVMYYYQRKTFGCPIFYNVKLQKVLYGSKKDNCLLKEDLAQSIVEKSCSRSTCNGVQASNRYFNNTDPCQGKSVLSSNKILNITYTCEKDTAMSDTTGCPSGYRVFDGGDLCYKLYLNEVNVTEAQTMCQNDDGADLTSVNSLIELLQLTTMLSDLYKPTDLWIGLKYDPIQQTYSWMNGRPLEFTNWYDKQPDGRLGSYVKMSLLEGGQFLYWKQASGKEVLPFICRKLKVKATERPIETTTLAQNATCPGNWTRHKNSCYFLSSEQMSYIDARVACRQKGEGSDLASILSDDENNAIFTMFEKSKYYFAWFGLTNEALLRGFHWTDGSPLRYINWYTNRPHTGSRHLCAGMNNGGKWWDLGCHSKYPYICKAPVGNVYVPTTTPLPTTTTTQDPSLCGSKDWIFWNNNCYYFSALSGLDWRKARFDCENKTSVLTSIRDQHENDYIAQQIKRLKWNTRAHIGLNDLASENGWTWLDGTIMNYNNFDAGLPDDWHGMEDCVEMKTNGKWNDIACNVVRPYICKRKLGATPKPTSKVTAKPDSGYCMSGWKRYGTKCYLFKLNAKEYESYEDATSYCRQYQGGDLVSIHNSYENAFVLSQLSDHGSSIFIGLSDRQTEGLFLWNDQTSVDYTNWYTRQPSRYGNEDCVEMMPFYKHHGQWNDISCAKKSGFVCQLSSTSTKPSMMPTKVPNPCPKDYMLFNKNCYSVVKGPKTFNAALLDCQNESNGNLISLHDPYEQAFVYSHFSQKALETWIGLYRNDKDKPWEWVDKTTFDYKRWDSYSSTLKPNCVKQINNGKWEQENCTFKLPYTCKITLTSTSETQSFIGNCSDGWTKFKNKCYKFFDKYSEIGQWSEVREKCKSHGGNLAKIQDKETQMKLSYLIRETWRPAWIGLNDRRKEYHFEWSDGTPLLPEDYINWGYGEPSDNSGQENCVEISANGKWNDLSCSRRLAFICEHELECRDALGVENMMLPDDSFTATSYADQFFPRNARLNKQNDGQQTAWCTNITDAKQSLTVNLTDLVTVTRIATQGLYIGGKQNNYVISYMLEYSLDGKHWMNYQEYENGQLKIRILPGNLQSRSIEGTTINVKATFLRFTPKKFKGDLVCLRLELYGCKAACAKPLGLSSYMISDKQLFASSNQASVTNIRLTAQKNPTQFGWCSQSSDSDPWIKIDLLHRMKITRVSVTGKGYDYYYVLFKDKNDEWYRSKTLQGQDKKFPLTPSTHDLEVQAVTKYIKFDFSKTKDVVCAQMEILGCTYECDSQLNVKPSMISASSTLDHYDATKALSPREGNIRNAWCAKKNDISQYLQYDFGSSQVITSIATQGLIIDNKALKYVTLYNVQYSFDGIFWHQSNKKFSGSVDGVTIQKNHLEPSIKARFIRINPVEYVIGICMRVELYGCPLVNIPSTVKPPVTTPKPATKSFLVTMRLTQVKYTQDLNSENSIEYQRLKEKVEGAVQEIYENGNNLYSVKVKSFKSGSVISTFEIKFYDDKSLPADPLKNLKEAIKNGKVGEFVVDKNSFKKGSDGGTKKKQESSSGLSNGGKIGLIVFFVVAILVVMVIGFIYFKRRKNGLQYMHKSFGNPVHMTSSAGDDDDKVHFVDDDDLQYR